MKALPACKTNSFPHLECRVDLIRLGRSRVQWRWPNIASVHSSYQPEWDKQAARETISSQALGSMFQKIILVNMTKCLSRDASTFDHGSPPCEKHHKQPKLVRSWLPRLVLERTLGILNEFILSRIYDAPILVPDVESLLAPQSRAAIVRRRSVASSQLPCGFVSLA